MLRPPEPRTAIPVQKAGWSRVRIQPGRCAGRPAVALSPKTASGRCRTDRTTRRRAVSARRWRPGKNARASVHSEATTSIGASKQTKTFGPAWFRTCGAGKALACQQPNSASGTSCGTRRCPRNGAHVMQKQFLAKFVVVAALLFPVSSFGQGGGGGGGGSSGGGSAGGASAGGAASGGGAATSGAGTAAGTGTATGSTATGAATGSTATGSTATGTSTGGAVNNSGTGTAAGPSNTGAPAGTINSPGTNNASTGLTQGADQAATPAAPGTNTSGTAISTGSGRAGTTTGTARNQGAANGNRIDGTVTPGPSMPGDAEIRAEDPKVDAKIKSICRGC